MAGKLIILSGPSGTGKSSIARKILENDALNLAFSISATSRAKRDNEVDGKDYYFLSIDSFKSKIEENEFLEWEEVYPKQYYGTLKIEIERLKSMGKNVLFDVDVNGAMSIKRSHKENSVSIFIKSPSVEALEERLRARNTETEDSIARRIRKVNLENTYARKFDYIVVNENLEEAINEVIEIVKNSLG